jgi:acid phosphatase (class A)
MSNLQGRPNHAHLLSWVLAFFLLLPLRLAAVSEAPYLAPNHPDGITLLAPPPVADSAEQAADLATVRTVFQARTEEDKARALKTSSLAFSLFQPAIGPVFAPGNLPKTEALLLKVKNEVGGIIESPKNHWKRPRPYIVDASLSAGYTEASFSYPSGHSARGTLYALLLADLFPSHKEPILAIGRGIGWDRVLIGMHFPTDVQAGRVLGQAIANELFASPSFQHDLSEAKAEIEAAQPKLAEPAATR